MLTRHSWMHLNVLQEERAYRQASFVPHGSRPALSLSSFPRLLQSKIMEAKLLLIPWMMAVIYSSIPLFWFAVHPLAPRWRKMRGSPYRALLPLWSVTIFGLAWVTWPGHAVKLYSPRHSPWIFLSAQSAWLFAFGARIYWHVRSSFAIENFIGETELRSGEYPERLATSGMHSQVRHPIYLAHLFMMAGWAVFSGLLVPFVLLALSLFLTFPAMIWLEEQELEQRFGPAYREYKETVPLIGKGFFLSKWGENPSTGLPRGKPREV
jgi:protein-S-isoprenylcysteine O-methyltransferase Ste14